MRYSTERVRSGLEHLRRADPVMRDLVERVGQFRLRRARDRFRLLVRSIVSQQISTKAARSIRLRLEQLVAPQPPTALNLSRLATSAMRGAGLSAQKAAYLLDLCEHVLDGRLRLETIGRKSDEDIIADLVQVKGIGRWTAQMFLIFGLVRLDVFPHDDLGVRTALHRLYRLEDLPKRAAAEGIAAAWRPYASIATWYCWRSLDPAAVTAAETAAYPV
ncbi:MAG: DNA-3-methyladenine glycosylase 2 family protein [Planctomycetes bacterium]|nr:DNA-3-methyladenine glycosylase 2 family protein [Planctomycetota bacterium]